MKNQKLNKIVTGHYQRYKASIADAITEFHQQLIKVSKPLKDSKIIVIPAFSKSDFKTLTNGGDDNFIITVEGVINDVMRGITVNPNIKSPCYRINIFGHDESLVGEYGSILVQSIGNFICGYSLIEDVRYDEFDTDNDFYKFSVMLRLYKNTTIINNNYEFCSKTARGC